MRSEGYSSRFVCVCMHLLQRFTINADVNVKLEVRTQQRASLSHMIEKAMDIIAEESQFKPHD